MALLSTPITMMTTLLLMLLATSAMAFVFTLLMIPLARRCGLVDRPDGHRKLHAHATPLGGGLAVLAALVIGGALAWAVPNPYQQALREQTPFLLALLGASLLIVAVGLMDDRFDLRGRHKLLGQIAAALVLVLSGVSIRHVQVFGFGVDLALLAAPFTLFWLMGAINSVNLLDGMDGLATTIGIILSASLGVMAALSGHGDVAILALALAGSLLGFLCLNFPPAKIFLGDAGSMLVGLVLGALAIRGALKGPATVALAAPLAVWAVPILDSAAAIVRRKLTGQSIYTTDRGHLHHRLKDALGSNVAVLSVVALCCAATSAGALASVHMQNDLLALISVAAVSGILVVTRAFGYVELQHVARETKALAANWRTPLQPPQGQVRHTAMGQNTSQRWDQIWQALTESADSFNLVHLRLDITVPCYEASYHASWSRHCPSQRAHLWHTEIPLFQRSEPVGKLVASGERDHDSTCELLERLMYLLQSVEAEVSEPTPPAADHPAEAAVAPAGSQAVSLQR